jgi:hypothetical protein
MVIESHNAEWQLLERFLEALRALPDATAELDCLEPAGSAGGMRHDAKIDFHVAGTSRTLVIEVKKAVFPRDVRQSLWQLNKHRSDDTVTILVAESLSSGAKELLREERVGYYDSGGSLYLPAPGAYIYIDMPPPKTLSKSMLALYSGRRSQVLHALLLGHRDWFGVKQLAKQAQVSPATASQVLTELERFDWVVARGQGPSKERRLSEPAALLDSWVKQLAVIRPAGLRRYYVPSAGGDKLLDHLGKVFSAHGVEYAISHEAAAQRYAPFLTSVSQLRCRLLAGPGANAALGELGARGVNEGANLAIIEVKSSGDMLFRERLGDIWLASPVQVYLDLLRGEGRAKEMAEHLRKEKIGF